MCVSNWILFLELNQLISTYPKQYITCSAHAQNIYEILENHEKFPKQHQIFSDAKNQILTKPYLDFTSDRKPDMHEKYRKINLQTKQILFLRTLGQQCSFHL